MLDGLKGKLFGKGNAETAKDSSQPLNTGEERVFCLGVEDVFKLKGNDDLMVVGRVEGHICENDAIYVSNPADDDTPVGLSVAKELYIAQNKVKEVADGLVSVCVEGGAKLCLKPGTVIHSRSASVKSAHDAYINGLKNGLIGFRRMKLDGQMYEMMSVTDLAELYLLLSDFYKTADAVKDKDLIDGRQEITSTLTNKLLEKILNINEFYVPFNKKTGEPHMYSVTYINDNGDYVTEPPGIKIITKAYLSVVGKTFDPAVYEIRKIEKGENGKGIYNFLGETFYLNGACGIKLIYDRLSIAAGSLIEKPDYSGVPEINRPVTNPDVERWLLMIGQLNKATTPEEEKLHMTYYGHLFRELANAKFVIPMQLKGEISEPDKDGNAVIKKDSTMSIAVREGKGDRGAVSMFTDWKRMRMVYKEEDGWNALVQSISQMIETFDCAINATEYMAAGCYIDKEFYENSIKRHITG